jgi:hypothetical protein
MRNYLEPQLHLHLKACALMNRNSSTRKHCSVRNTTTQHHGLQCQKAQYDSGRIKKELVLGLAKMFSKHNRRISVDDPAIDLAVVAAIYPRMKILQSIKILLFCWRSGTFRWNSSRKPVDQAHSRSRKTRVFDHFLYQIQQNHFEKYRDTN